LLRTEQLTKRFGGVTALDDVSIEVPAGEITGLIGPNGSGKSTFFDVVTGFVPNDAGHIWFDGQLLDGVGPRRTAQRGMIRTFQVARLAPRMTVLENLMMVQPGGPGESVGRLLCPWWARRVADDEKLRVKKASGMVELLEMDRVRNELAGTLSGGQAKLLSFGMALMVEPRMLCLDEPVAGVNTRIIDTISRLLRERCEAGLTVLIIEHNMSLLWDLCSEVIALNLGRVISRGVPSELQRDPAVIDAYLGRSA
jgi:ABC-type branched-subunit amino acid transport system ATPase component